MPYIALLILLLVLAPSSALAADLSVKSHEGRTLMVRYEDMKGASLSVLSSSGEVVRSSRLPKATGVKRVMLPKNLEAGTYTILASDREGAKYDSETFTISYPAPTCTLKASEKALHKGDLLRIRWNSDNATSAVLFGQKKVALNGSERISVHHLGPHGYAVNLVGPGGVGSCAVEVKVVE
ncbi:MAG TPA: hypothetical protein VEA92_03600 [Candidatus Paceibacterota bacterium]|nr:hypothetical protein [Candidatus Paceibacterota bacterium]